MICWTGEQILKSPYILLIHPWFTHLSFIYLFFLFIIIFLFFFLNIEANHACVQYLYLRILKNDLCHAKLRVRHVHVYPVCPASHCFLNSHTLPRMRWSFTSWKWYMTLFQYFYMVKRKPVNNRAITLIANKKAILYNCIAPIVHECWLQF